MLQRGKKTRSKSDKRGYSLAATRCARAKRKRVRERERERGGRGRGILPGRAGRCRFVRSFVRKSDNNEKFAVRSRAELALTLRGVDASGGWERSGPPARARGGRPFGKHSGAWKTVEGTEERKTVVKLLQFFQTAARPSARPPTSPLGGREGEHLARSRSLLLPRPLSFPPRTAPLGFIIR